MVAPVVISPEETHCSVNNAGRNIRYQTYKLLRIDKKRFDANRNKIYKAGNNTARNKDNIIFVKMSKKCFLH